MARHYILTDNGSVCDNVVVDKISRPGFTLRSPSWASLASQIKVALLSLTFRDIHDRSDFRQEYSTVYDIGDPRKPLEKDWFALQKHASRWTNDLAGRASPKREYALEHILKWQILRDFIEEDKDTNPLASRCVHLHIWFLNSMPKGNHKVTVAKNNGELGKNDRFDYEDRDYTLDTWDQAKQPTPRMIEWIGTS
jgi:hypothetical protein